MKIKILKVYRNRNRKRKNKEILQIIKKRNEYSSFQDRWVKVKKAYWRLQQMGLEMTKTGHTELLPTVLYEYYILTHK